MLRKHRHGLGTCCWTHVHGLGLISKAIQGFQRHLLLDTFTVVRTWKLQVSDIAGIHFFSTIYYIYYTLWVFVKKKPHPWSHSHIDSRRRTGERRANIFSTKSKVQRGASGSAAVAVCPLLCNQCCLSIFCSQEKLPKLEPRFHSHSRSVFGWWKCLGGSRMWKRICYSHSELFLWSMQSNFRLEANSFSIRALFHFQCFQPLLDSNASSAFATLQTARKQWKQEHYMMLGFYLYLALSSMHSNNINDTCRGLFTTSCSNCQALHTAFRILLL